MPERISTILDDGVRIQRVAFSPEESLVAIVTLHNLGDRGRYQTEVHGRR
jgi:hypothetical protein